MPTEYRSRCWYFIADLQKETLKALQRCQKGMQAVTAMEEELYSLGLISQPTTDNPGDPGVVRLESTLFQLGAQPSVCQGMFYMLPIKLNDLYIVRYVD